MDAPPPAARPSAARPPGARRPGPDPRVAVGVLALALLALAGRALWPRADVPLAAPDPAGAHAPLAVVLARAEGEPDQAPVVVGDTLRVRVRYAGDCLDHAFRLDRDRAGDTTVLVLHHDRRGDACTGEVYDELRLPLPRGVRGAPGVVVLKNPEGGAPFGL